MVYDAYLEAERRRERELGSYRAALSGPLDSAIYQGAAISSALNAQAMALATAGLQSSTATAAAPGHLNPMNEHLAAARALSGTLETEAALRQQADIIAGQFASISALDETRARAATSALGFRDSGIENLTTCLPGGLGSLPESMAHQLAQSRLIADIVRENSQAGFASREHSILLTEVARTETNRQMEFESYRQSADAWIAGQIWQPSAHSVLEGIGSAQGAAINIVMGRWRDQPGYVGAFTALAAASDAITATQGARESYASLFGDIRALAYGPDFESSPQARLRALPGRRFRPAVAQAKSACARIDADNERLCRSGLVGA